MTDNKERDQQARRILREAHSLLRKPVEPYTPPARMLYDELDEPEPFQPEPVRRQRLDTAPPSEPDWSGWEQWLETRLNAALAIQREEIAEIIAHVIADERERAGAAWRDQVAGLRADLTRTEQLLEQLRRLVEIERHKVIDLPALPARRNDIN
jgi:hypothetical protein